MSSKVALPSMTSGSFLFLRSLAVSVAVVESNEGFLKRKLNIIIVELI